MPGVARRAVLTNTLDPGARPRAASIWSSSAAATSASSSRRCTGASAPRSPSSRRAPRLIGARGRGRLGGDRATSSRREGITVRTGAECIGLAPHERGRRGRRRLHATGRPRSSGRTCCSPSGRRPNTDDLGLDTAGVATDARGYITVDDACHQRARHLGARRLQRPRRLHAHRLQRLRDRRRQPARRREPRASATAFPRYALYIDPPLGRVGHDRGAGARERPAAADRQAADDAASAARSRRARRRGS